MVRIVNCLYLFKLPFSPEYFSQTGEDLSVLLFINEVIKNSLEQTREMKTREYLKQLNVHGFLIGIPVSFEHSRLSCKAALYLLILFWVRCFVSLGFFFLGMGICFSSVLDG